MGVWVSKLRYGGAGPTIVPWQFRSIVSRRRSIGRIARQVWAGIPEGISVQRLAKDAEPVPVGNLAQFGIPVAADPEGR